MEMIDVRFGLGKQEMFPRGETWANRKTHGICSTTVITGSKGSEHREKGAPVTGDQPERDPEIEDKETRKLTEGTLKPSPEY